METIEATLAEASKEPPPPPKDLAVPGQAVKVTPIQVDAGILRPKDSDEVKRLATLAFESGLAPKGAKNVPQAIMGILAGLEVGLTFVQACRQVMVVNGSPSLWGDAPLGLVMKSGKLEDIQTTWSGDGDKLAVSVTCKRTGVASTVTGEFSVEAAKRAGLWEKSGPWKQYPRRMLELRARAFALRNLFPDVLLGCAIAEDIQDVADQDAKTDELTKQIESL